MNNLQPNWVQQEYTVVCITTAAAVCLMPCTSIFALNLASGGHGLLGLRSRIGYKTARGSSIHCRPCKLSVDDTQPGDQWHRKIDPHDSAHRTAYHQGENCKQGVDFEFVSHNPRRNSVVHQNSPSSE